MELATTSWGEGDRQVLLIHGLGSNKEGWWRVGPWFAERGWTAHAVDLPGHGASPKSVTYTLDLLADALPFVDGGWDLAIGHSLGGAVAARAAAVDGFADALVLEDPLVFEIRREVGLAEFDLPLEPEFHVAANPAWHPRDAHIKVDALRQCGPETVAGIATGFEGNDLVEEIRSLAVPTLVVGAGIEPLVTPELGGLLAAGANVDFTTIPDSSHSIHRDEFEPFMGAIGEWLDDR
ncbi:MAG: alpha/beta hydrolase [Acidimicrobiia bacterium]|nr:alpha/beta hydrolase [Acidimicrobiia bacterium]